MKILSWKMSELGGVKKCQLVKECCMKCKPNVCILQETKKDYPQ